jgi:hypothetical protein
LRPIADFIASLSFEQLGGLLLAMGAGLIVARFLARRIQ